MKWLFILMLLLLIAGCETPEGGSSLPWSQPEPWETQAVPNIEEQ